jgi:hypothetical protein
MSFHTTAAAADLVPPIPMTELVPSNWNFDPFQVQLKGPISASFVTKNSPF